VLFLQPHAALGKLEGLLVAVLYQRDVCLVVDDDAKGVVGADGRCETLGLAQGRYGLLDASVLGKDDRRQRVEEREVSAIAGSVKGRSRLRDVLADNGVVTNLSIAEAELIVDEPDGLRIVGELGLFEGAPMESNRAGLITPGEGNPSVKSPERREPRGRNRIAQGIRQATEHCTCLIHIVAHQAGFGHCATQRQLVVSSERRGAQSLLQDGAGLGGTTSFERGAGLRECGLKSDAHHGAKYTTAGTASRHRGRGGMAPSGSPREVARVKEAFSLR
jgi:hypothetical protein